MHFSVALLSIRVLPQPAACYFVRFLSQVFDAGDYFGIMQVEEADEEEEGDEEMEEFKKKPNPGNEPCFKVIVTNENGLQASNPNR